MLSIRVLLGCCQSPESVCEKRRKMGFISTSLPFPPMSLTIRLRGGVGRVCSSSLCWSAMSSGGWRVLLCQNFPPSAVQSLAGADPGYQSPTQLFQPAFVRLSIPGCMCVSGEVEGGWIARCCLCVCMHACVCPISLPGRLFQNTPLIKVGQVWNWTLFLSESNFQVLPVRRSSYLRQWLHGVESLSPPSPLASTGPLENVAGRSFFPCYNLLKKTIVLKKFKNCINKLKVFFFPCKSECE